MKKRVITKVAIVGITIIAFCLLGFSVFAVRNQDDPFYQWGQLENSHRSDATVQAEDSLAIVGEHFEVYADELNFLIEKQKLVDPDTAESVAEEILIQKYSLYYQAVEADVVVSDEYVDAVIEENIEIFAEASSEEYAAFLEGIGMTNEEYWYSCADELKITESIAAWKSLQYDAFLEENGYDTAPPDDLGTLWESYYSDLEADIIESEHVQIYGVTAS
jgi:hypothetical protein